MDEERDGYQLKQGTLGYLHAKQNRPDMAHEQIRLIKQLKEQDKCNFPNFNCSLVYAGLNQLDKMFYHLDKAYSEKPVALMFIRADPFWEPFREDKRFIALVDKIFNCSPRV